MKIIAFTGMPCSGKSEAVKIAKEQDIPVIRMGDCIWEEVESQGLDFNDRNVGKVANDMRKIHGKDIWAKRTLEKIKAFDKKNVIVIDGLRNPEEVDFFKQKLGSEFVFVAVNASTETRRKRALSRKRKDDSMDVSVLEERDRRELSWGLGDVIKSADIIITNENGLDVFQREIKEVLAKI